MLLARRKTLKTFVLITSKNSASACVQIWTTCTILGRGAERQESMQDENDENWNYGQPDPHTQRQAALHDCLAQVAGRWEHINLNSVR